MLRAILLGIGIVALILFVAWVFRDPIYLKVKGSGEPQPAAMATDEPYVPRAVPVRK